ncbi:MAG: sigma-70 family RNA polymerase sigma factor [Bryobacterales bacterium]|nr:sigma-70 family RNA polymerase sigma factor [Bryobacterales bacterium]
MSTGDTGQLLDHLFRQQSGRIVSHLARQLGPAHLDLAEEAAQDALLRALQSWPFHGVPENPAAWLFRSAYNAAIDAIRRRQLSSRHTETLVGRIEQATQPLAMPGLEERLRDDELRLMFMCCHPAIPRDAGVALALKTVAGFGVREIARAFLADERTIAQRLVRAKKLVRDQDLTLDLPAGPELAPRLDVVLEVIYFLFNEGYAVHDGTDAIREDLCGEALRLSKLVAESSLATPKVQALVALMAFQGARLPARVDASGDLVLLEDQDHALWDQNLIAMGFHYFDRSMQGAEVSSYHAEAAIAATHARAPSSHQIEWRLILHIYDQLLALTGSPVVALNRAVALAKVEGPEAALRDLEPLRLDSRLRDYHLLLAARGQLLLDAGRPIEAAADFTAALERPCSEPERRLLRRKLQRCL